MTDIIDARESQESEQLMEDPSRTHARANRHSVVLSELEPMHPEVLVDLEERLKPTLAKQPGLPTRTTEWLWSCHRGHQIVLWSKARAVQCDSGCESRQWEVLLKQDPNESTEGWESRLAEAGRKPYEPRWDEMGRRIV